MHCDRHTQTPLCCANFQAFWNTFSLYKLTFFHFLSGGIQETSLTVEMWNCHSWPLDASTRGVDLLVDLPIWALTVEASWSAIMSSNSRNLILPFLTTRCNYKGVDLLVDLPIWALTVEASWSANMSSNSRNVISPFLTTRSHYRGLGYICLSMAFSIAFFRMWRWPYVVML